MPEIATLPGFILLAGMMLVAPAFAQQPAPPQEMKPAAAKPAEPSPAAAVVPAEQVAPLALTGLLGHLVLDAEGKDLGHIIDLLVDGQGHVRAVVLDIGGFMGIGNRKVAVAWAALRFATDAKGPVMSVAIPPDRITSWADYIAGRPVSILGAPGTGP